MLRLPLLKLPCVCRPSTCSSRVLHHSRTHTTGVVQVNEGEGTEVFGHYSIILPPEPFIFGVSHIKRREVPTDIEKPPYVLNNGNELQEGVNKPESIIELGGEAESRLRKVAQLASRVREFAGPLVKVILLLWQLQVVLTRIQVGVTTNAIDSAIHDFILSHKAYPSPLGYLGFPRSCCTSVNNILVHGIPDEYVFATDHTTYL